jgi:hypothetical protein
MGEGGHGILQQRYGQCSKKIRTVPTGHDSANTMQTCFQTEEVSFLGCCTIWSGNCFPVFWRSASPSSVGLWVCELTHNPEDEGGRFIRNFSNKLPNCTTQQHRRPSSTTITWCKPQITVLLLNIHVIFISDYSIFLICCVLLMNNRFSLTEWNDHDFHNIWTRTDNNITVHRTGNVHEIAQWDVLMQTLLQWKNSKYYIFWVCVYSIRYPACNAYAPYCHLRPALPCCSYNISPHYLTNGTTVNRGKKKLLSIQWVSLFSLQLSQQHVSL